MILILTEPTSRAWLSRGAVGPLRTLYSQSHSTVCCRTHDKSERMGRWKLFRDTFETHDLTRVGTGEKKQKSNLISREAIYFVRIVKYNKLYEGS